MPALKTKQKKTMKYGGRWKENDEANLKFLVRILLTF